VIRTDSDQEGTEKRLKGRWRRVLADKELAVRPDARKRKRAVWYGGGDSRCNLNAFELKFG
jgi:hypothetical protein